MKRLHRICFSMLMFPILFLAVGLLFIFTGYSNYQDYQAAYDVTATVTKCTYDLNYGSDDLPDKGYKIYISYTFDGKEYTDIYWDRQADAINIGKTVSVKVSSERPDNPLQGSRLGMLIAGIPFALLGIILSFMFIPASISKEVHFDKRSQSSGTSKKAFWFVLIPVVPAIIFLMLGLYSSPMFHIGTILFAYFVVVVLEIAAE